MVRQALFTLTKAWREVVRELTDPYRPELHYMRGPGRNARQSRGGSNKAELKGSVRSVRSRKTTAKDSTIRGRALKPAGMGPRPAAPSCSTNQLAPTRA